jgi:hypothetical protein
VPTRLTPPTSKNPTSSGSVIMSPQSSGTAPRAGPRRPAPTSRRVPVRPLDDGTTELVRVIQFVWRAGRVTQPVLMVERELLN